MVINLVAIFNFSYVIAIFFQVDGRVAVFSREYVVD